MIQNSTDGTILDLWECAVGKEWTRYNTESATVAFPHIYNALRDPGKERVVVVAHSQGTIIMASMWHGLKYLVRRHNRALRADLDSREMPLDLLASIVQSQLQLDMRDFPDLTEQEVAKLEMYCFANCATGMRYLRQPPGCPPIPWIENFGSEFDLVARLGMLAPHPEEHHIHLDGPMYWRPGAWGHLLNLHYLNPIAEQQHVGAIPGGATGDASPFVLKNGEKYPPAVQPRLYAYINGGTAPNRLGAPEVATIELSAAPA